MTQKRSPAASAEHLDAYTTVFRYPCPDFRRVSAEQLKEMSVKEIVDKFFDCYLTAYTMCPDQADYIFDSLLALDAKKCREAVDRIEKDLVFETRDMVNRKISMGHLRFNGGSWYEGNRGTDTVIKLRQADLQIFNRILEIKGEAADPFTKAAVNEGAKLSGKEYNDGLKLFDALEKAYKAVTPPKPGQPRKNRRQSVIYSFKKALKHII